MPALVTLEEAKLRLRIVPAETAFDGDLAMKIEQATDIVVDYIKQANHTWTDVDSPPLIKAAILEVVKNLFEGAEPLPQAIKNILWRYRDPALA
jgi:hypothetical protein